MSYIPIQAESKIRTFLSLSQAQSPSVSGVIKVVTFDSESTRITKTSAVQTGGNILTPTQSGVFNIFGQLTIVPTAGSIDGVVVDIVRNGSVIQSISDFGAVWAIGIARTIEFGVGIELTASDAIKIQMTHTGSVGSGTEFSGGDNDTWVALNKINSVSTTATSTSTTDLTPTAIKTAIYTAQINEIVICDPTGGGFIINLPSAGGNNGKRVVVKNKTSSVNSITVTAAGGENIDGSSTYIINTGFEALYLISNGAGGWSII